MVEDPGEPCDTAASVPERLLVSALALLAVAAPYALRGLDDNRLTSWRWVFAGRDPAALFGLALAAALLAHLAARLAPARRREAWLFLCAFAAGACFWSEPEPIVDVARYFTQAKHLELYGVVHFARGWGREIPAWTDLPLVPFLYGLVLRASGESRLAVEAFTTLLFALSAVLTARLGAALWDEALGLSAGALLLASPYLLAQAPAMLVDVPTLFFLVLAAWASVRALQDGGARRILAAAVAVCLALYAKYSAALLLTVVPVAALVLRRAGARAALRTLAAVVLAAGGLALAWALPHHDVHAGQLALLLAYQAPGLRRWGESFLSTFLFQVHPLVAAAALASAWRAWRRRDARWIVAAWPALLLLALGVRRARYLIPVLPMLALLAAYGLRALRPEVRRLAVASAVLSSLAVGVWGYLPFLRATSAENLAAAGAYLDGLAEPRVEVLTASAPGAEVNPAVSVPILDLFTRKPLVYDEPAAAPPTGPAAGTSPLRFTWELGVPPWYAPVPGGGPPAIAVIRDREAPLPARVAARLAGHVLARAFEADEGVFGHATRVEVYRPAPRATSAPGAQEP